MASELELLQRRFWHLITAPEGVGRALGEGRDLLEAEPLEAWIQPPPQGSALERLELYANMYFYRLHETLRKDCPKLLALLGDRHFHNLVTDYLLARPSEHPSLRQLTRHLAAFLRVHPLSERWPCASDVAALEWARAEAFDAPDSAVLERAWLAGVAPQHWEGISFAFSPSLRLLDLQHSIRELWTRLDVGAEPTRPERMPTTFCIWRQNFIVYHRPVSAPEALALRAARGGAPFREVCERIAEVVGAPAAAQAAAELVNRWVSDGLLSAADFEMGRCDGVSIVEVSSA